MAFPRHFKRETWYARLPSGDVELLSASALENAFSCGLVDARTPVRTPSSTTWTTLHEAADFEPGERTSVASLTPTSMEVLPSDEGVGARYTINDRDLDPRAIRGSRTPFAMTVIAILAVVGIGFASFTRETSASETTASRLSVAAGGTAERPTLRKRTGFTDEQMKRLHDIDFKHRWEGFGLPGHASHVVSRSQGAFTPAKTKKSVDLHLKGDPLDGAL